MGKKMAIPPTEEEIAFADQILLHCNCQQTGSLPAAQAVEVFNRSGLSRYELRDIWGLADADANGTLEKEELIVALRVMGWVQNGKPFTEALVDKPGPPPKIEGIARPVPPELPAPSTSSSSLPPNLPIVLGLSVRKYRDQWVNACPVDGFLEGDAVREIYMRSNLSYSQLSGIWTLVDTQRVGRLNFSQFAVGLYLIDALKSCQLPAVPTSLPPYIFDQFPETTVEEPRSPFVSPDERSEGPPFPVPQPAPPLTHQRTKSRPPPVPAKSPSLPPKPPPPPKPTKKPWGVTPSLKSEYDKEFAALDVDGTGLVPEDHALKFLRRYELPIDDLATIWDLAAIRNDKFLNSDEFAVAMYLVNERRAGKAIPFQLPLYLIPPSLRSEPSVSSPISPILPPTPARRDSTDIGPAPVNGHRLARPSISQLAPTPEPGPPEPPRPLVSQMSLAFLSDNPTAKAISRRRTTVVSPTEPDDPFEELRAETKTLRQQVGTLLEQLSSQNEYRTANEQLRTENSALKTKISELESSMESVLRQMQSNDNALSDGFRREVDRLMRRVAELEQTESQLQQTAGILEVAKRDNALLTAQMRELRSAEATHKVEIEAARSAAEGLERENEELKARLTDMTKAMSEPDNANSSRELRVLMKDVTRENTKLKGRVRELERSMENMLLSNREEGRTEEIKRENRELKMQIQELEMLTAQLQSTHEESHLQQVLMVMARENDGMKARIRDLQAHATQTQQEVDGRIAEMQRRLDQLERENTELKQQAAARPPRRDSITGEDMSVPPPAYDDNMFLPAESS